MNDGPNATWLPNLVGGVSIWKLLLLPWMIGVICAVYLFTEDLPS